MQKPRWSKTVRVKFLVWTCGTRARCRARVVLEADELLDGRMCQASFRAKLAEEIGEGHGLPVTSELLAEHIGHLAVDILAISGYRATRVAEVEVRRRDEKESASARWD